MKNPIRLSNGVSIVSSQEELIDAILSSQLEKSHARLILLIDSNGQVISFHGERGNIDLVALGALTASDFAASGEIAQITNLYQENQLVIRQGSKMNTIVFDVNRNLILLYIVPASVPLGWVCYLVRDSAAQIKETVEKFKTTAKGKAFEADHSNLREMVSDALDQVWKEQ
jgi:predicted regulator of Ras-like GTPase activity (Roadblock/LC7/MglB family)